MISRQGTANANRDVMETIELRLPCKAEWVGVARLAVAGVASRLNFSVEDVDDLKLAVAEACTNCIQHASDSDEVRIACAVYGDRLVVTVEDHGKGFDGRGVTPKALGEPKVGGLGVFLIRTLMDDVSYEVDPKNGTKLIMTKHLRK
jgi:serine/threonine-protein kinase RsbW